jgi:hypothetical protein
MIRGLADTQTTAGRRACKVIITGTPLMCDRFDRFELSRPEELQAFKDRIALNRISLAPWSQADIWAWWEQLTRVMGGVDTPLCPKRCRINTVCVDRWRAPVGNSRHTIRNCACCNRRNPDELGGPEYYGVDPFSQVIARDCIPSPI